MVAFLKRAVLPLALAIALVPAARAESGKRDPLSNIPVSGTSADGNAFRGTMNILGFVNDNGLKAIGSLTGTITSSKGTQQVAGEVVTIPVVPDAATRTGFGGLVSDSTADSRAAVAQVAGGCNILHLHLGALDLNLLGLAVHLDPVTLDITAVPGAGNLLGNLLCAVANY